MTPLDLCLSGALVFTLLWGLGERWARHDVAADRDEWRKAYEDLRDACAAGRAP